MTTAISVLMWVSIDKIVALGIDCCVVRLFTVCFLAAVCLASLISATQIYFIAVHLRYVKPKLL